MAEHTGKRDGPALRPEAKAPAFTLPRDGGGSVSLGDFAGRKLVLYFYPRADTSGCTKEAIDFSRLKSAFGRAGTDILGVSGDPVPAQDAFKKKHKLSIALASDEKHQHAGGLWRVAGKIDVWQKIPWHRAHNISDRSRPANRPNLAESIGRRATPRRFWPPLRLCKHPQIA